MQELCAGLAGRDVRIAQLEQQFQQTAARLDEVSRDYILALDEVQRSRAAQSASIAEAAAAMQAHGDAVTQLQEAQASIAERDARLEQLDAQLQQTARRLDEVSSDYLTALAAVERSARARWRRWGLCDGCSAHRRIDPRAFAAPSSTPAEKPGNPARRSKPTRRKAADHASA